MADPLSVAASVAGLLSIAEVVFRRIFKYAKRVENADREILELLTEVNTLVGVLRSVELVADELKALASSHVIQPIHIHDCNETLSSLRETLSHFDETEPDDNKVRLLKRRWKWPFSREETLDIRNKVHAHKSLLSLALTAESVSATILLYDKTTALGTIVNQIATRLEAETRIATDERRNDLLRILTPVNPLDSQKTNNKLWHPGTGLWFFESEEFKVWASTKNSKLWVYGIPGAGKTILASAAIQRLVHASDEENAVAYFYCDYKDPLTQTPRAILGSLAQQIARQNERSFDKFEEFIKRNSTDRRGREFSADDEKVKDLIVEMAEDYENVIIAIDGLDECGDHIEKSTFHLASLNRSSPTIKTLLSSRDLIQIRDLLDDYKTISIAARNSDLKLYVGSEIEERVKKTSVKRLRFKDPLLKGEIMDTLIKGAEGMFRWTSLQLDLICELPTDKTIRKALKSLPPDLYSSYDRLLEDINKRHKDIQILVQRALRWILHERLKTSSLCEAVAVDQETQRSDESAIVDEDTILRWCGSFVRKNADGDHLEPAHFTVKEYLLSIDPLKRPELAPYRLDQNDDEIYFAITALTYLCYEDFGLPCKSYQDLIERWKAHPFRDHAVLKWATWARCHSADSVVLALEKLLFCTSDQKNLHSWGQEYFIQKASYYRKYNFDEYFIQLRDSYMSIPPLNYAALLALPELCQWLLGNGLPNDTRNTLGNPIHCSLLGFRALANDYFLLNIPFDPSTVDDRPFSYVKEALDILLASGANIDERWESQSEAHSTLYIAALLYLFKDSGSLIISLLNAGCYYEDDFIDCLIEQYDDLPAGVVDAIKPENARTETQKSAIFPFVRHNQEKLSSETHEYLKCSLRLHDNEKVKYVEMLLRAVYLGHFKMATRLVSIDVVNMRGANGVTLLHAATSVGNEDIARLLIDHGAEMYAVDDEGLTPMALAARRGHLNLVNFFVELQVDETMKDSRGRTLLHQAALDGHSEIVQLFIDRGHDPSVRDIDGLNALQHAVTAEPLDLSSIQILYNHDSELALDVRSDLSAFDILLENHFFDHNVGTRTWKAIDLLKPSILGQEGRIMRKICSSVHRLNSISVSNHSRMLLEKLLGDDAVVIDINCVSGCLEAVLDALRIVATGREADKQSIENIALFLVDLIPPTELENMRSRGFQPLSVALRSGANKLATDILTKTMTADTRDDNEHAYSPMEQACAINCEIELFDKLLAASKKLYRKHTKGDSLLNLAAISASPSHVQKLLDAGLNPDETGRNSRTAISDAALAGRSENVDILQRAGADTSIKDHNDWAPVHHAASKGHLGVLKLLASNQHCWKDQCAVTCKGVVYPMLRLLHLAALSRNRACLEYLIEACPEVTVNDCVGGATVLVMAVISEDETMVELLLDRGASSLLACPNNLATPLHEAAAIGNQRIVDLLLQYGADVLALDAKKNTPRMRAIGAGHSKIARFLEYDMLKAKDNFLETDASSERRAKATMRAMQRELSCAIADGNITLCKRLLNHGASLSEPCDSCGYCGPFICALRYSQIEIAQYILQEGGVLHGNTCSQHQTWGFNALHYCALEDWTDLLDMILGKCPGLLFVHTEVHPLHIAILNHSDDSFQLMLNKSLDAWNRFITADCLRLGDSNTKVTMLCAQMDKSERNKHRYHLNGPELIEVPTAYKRRSLPWLLTRKTTRNDLLPYIRTPIQCAAFAGNIAAAQILIDHGALLNYNSHEMLVPPLLLSVRNKHLQMAQLLIEHGASFFDFGPFEETCMQNAAISGDIQLVRQFEARGADIYDNDCDDRNIVSYAVEGNHVELLAILLAKGCKMSVVDEDGTCALRQCWLYEHPEMQTFLLNSGEDLADSTTDFGSCLNFQWTISEYSLLRRLLRRLGPENCRKLLNKKPKHRKTPLYDTAARGACSCAGLLLKAGADPDVVGGDLGTPLMAAAARGRLAIVQLLVDSGATICYIHEGHWVSVLDRARRFPDIVEWLMRGRWMRWRAIGWKESRERAS